MRGPVQDGSLPFNVETSVHADQAADGLQGGPTIDTAVDASGTAPVPAVVSAIEDLEGEVCAYRVVAGPVGVGPGSVRLMERGQGGGEDAGLAERGEEGVWDVGKEGLACGLYRVEYLGSGWGRGSQLASTGGPRWGCTSNVPTLLLIVLALKRT